MTPSRTARYLAPALITALLGVATLSSAQDTTTYPTLGSIERSDASIDTLLGPDAKIEVLAGGYAWTEGPVWVPRDGGFLLFSDIPPNRVVKWVAGQGPSIFLEPAGYSGAATYGTEPGSNGLALDPNGNLTLCEHGDRRVSLMTWDGGKRTLADNYQGKRLNSPNDCVWAKNGDLYFTDPPYGMPGQWDSPVRELDFCGVYRLSKAGELTVVDKTLARPNGIGLSPDGRTLYAAQSDPSSAIWRKYPVAEDGSVGEGELFYDVTSMVGQYKGLPDGFAVDQQGNLWASGPGGIFVFSPEGKMLGRILTGEATANCCFGGPDGSTLFITADMWLCKVETLTKGLGL